jgi:hypothetical protein
VKLGSGRELTKRNLLSDPPADFSVLKTGQPKDQS